MRQDLERLRNLITATTADIAGKDRGQVVNKNVLVPAHLVATHRLVRQQRPHVSQGREKQR